jgi:hypothetical protein
VREGISHCHINRLELKELVSSNNHVRDTTMANAPHHEHAVLMAILLIGKDIQPPPELDPRTESEAEDVNTVKPGTHKVLENILHFLLQSHYPTAEENASDITSDREVFDFESAPFKTQSLMHLSHYRYPSTFSPTLE